MKQLFLKTFFSILAASALLFLATLGWLRATDAVAEQMPRLQPGDLVFQTSRSNQSLAIMLASQSPYSHVGLVDVDARGRLVVLEAISTVQETPLQTWIDRGFGGRVLILRDPRLDSGQRTKLLVAARAHAGKPYDLFFHADRDSIYCSELVDFAYQDAGLHSVGAYQTLESLDLDNFAARKVIERRWQKHPACAEGKASSAESCVQILKNLTLITPDSMARDPVLKVVWSNYPG